MSIKNEVKKFVTPGVKLGVIEEFFTGPGTYELNGAIYSIITGHATIDAVNKRVSVNPLTKELDLPRKGSIVTGIVSNVLSKFAILKIFKIDNQILGKSFDGDLHISMANVRYERSINDVCKRADIVSAKVMDNKNGFVKLTTADRKLGVIKAFCSNCGNILLLKRNGLKCKKCDNFEKRKVSQDYVAKDFQRSNFR